MKLATVADILPAQRGSAALQLIDVRSTSEFASGHIPGAVNIPVDQIEARTADIRPEVPLILVCQGGARARAVAALLEPCRSDVAVLAGGTTAWSEAGMPLIACTKTRWSLERQVRLGAGLLGLAGTILTLILGTPWLAITAFVALGLTFAGLTDFCPMGCLLARMPWNRTPKCRVPAGSPRNDYV